jgi:hypothetical protein
MKSSIYWRNSQRLRLASSPKPAKNSKRRSGDVILSSYLWSFRWRRTDGRLLQEVLCEIIRLLRAFHSFNNENLCFELTCNLVFNPFQVLCPYMGTIRHGRYSSTWLGKKITTVVYYFFLYVRKLPEELRSRWNKVSPRHGCAVVGA